MRIEDGNKSAPAWSRRILLGMVEGVLYAILWYLISNEMLAVHTRKDAYIHL